MPVCSDFQKKSLPPTFCRQPVPVIINPMHQPAPSTQPGQKPRRPLPWRAKAVFAFCLFTIALSLGTRLGGYTLNRWGRAVVDGPMLASVAIASIIWGVLRNQPVSEPLHPPTEEESP